MCGGGGGASSARRGEELSCSTMSVCAAMKTVKTPQNDTRVILLHFKPVMSS